MSITLNLSPEQEAELKRYAAAAGTDLASLIIDVMREKLDESEGHSDDVSYEQWQRNFQSWIAMQRSRNPGFDDSRESIYD